MAGATQFGRGLRHDSMLNYNENSICYMKYNGEIVALPGVVIIRFEMIDSYIMQARCHFGSNNMCRKVPQGIKITDLFPCKLARDVSNSMRLRQVSNSMHFKKSIVSFDIPSKTPLICGRRIKSGIIQVGKNQINMAVRT